MTADAASCIETDWREIAVECTLVIANDEASANELGTYKFDGTYRLWQNSDDELMARLLASALIAAALAATAAQADSLKHFNDPTISQKTYQEFRDQISLQGKCPAWVWNDTEDQQNAALDACWLDFIAPRS